MTDALLVGRPTDGLTDLRVTRVYVSPDRCVHPRHAQVEPHLIHVFDDDFYGEELRFLVCGYVRPERSFPSLGQFPELTILWISVMIQRGAGAMAYLLYPVISDSPLSHAHTPFT